MNRGAGQVSRKTEQGKRRPVVRLGGGAAVFMLVLLFWSRYLPSPWAVLVGDDWVNLARSSFFASNAAAAWSGLQDPARPLSMIAVNVGYRVFRDHAAAWTLVSLAANSLLLLFTMKMAMELTGRRRVAVLTGVVLALLPNLTQTYHWSTQVLNEVACALAPYALSGWMWAAYVRRGGGWRLGISALGYFVGLFSYEAGILLPAAYLVLLPWRRTPWKSLGRMVPFGVVFLLYVAWRRTNAFGLNQAVVYPPHMQPGFRVWGIVRSSWDMFHWWAGDQMGESLVFGLRSFSTISLWTRRFLFAANVGGISLLGWGLWRLAAAKKECESAWSFGRWQQAGFAGVWTLAAAVAPLMSYVVPRLLVLPAMGVSLLAALALARWPIGRWGPALFLPALLCMTANQGTAEALRQAGAMQQGLYAHLQDTAEDWQSKKILLLDTRALRQRLTPGLVRPTSEFSGTWALYGHAPLMRGFVGSGMVQLITGRKDHGILVLHDVENGATCDGDRLVWHERYNPSKPRADDMADVFVADVVSAGWP
ncbi:MAG: hypothetical protein GX548_09980 [Lentisphaerae bacterium]|nr:hypothetical protein [Lentisphaerota bacterium]